MGSGSLSDTNIVIDLLAGIPHATQAVRSYRDRAISIVTWMEVLAGVRQDESVVRDVLDSTFTVIRLRPEIEEEAVVLRRGSKLKLPDALILATAHVERRVLLTRNSRDFRPGRFIKIPYKI